MGIRLIEVKNENLKPDEREFLFKISTTEHILHYEELMIGEKQLKEYFKKYPFPKDKYKKETFLEDLKCEGYVCIIVEKIETAQYIAELFYNLL